MSLERLPQAIVGTLLALACPAALACTVSATPIAFGTFNPISGVPADSTGSIVVSCPAETAYSVAIDGGSGTVGDRRMSSGADLLRFQLYSDANLGVVWGDGTGGTMTVAGSASPGADTTHTVYGRIPAQPQARTGFYTETLTVTVSY